MNALLFNRIEVAVIKDLTHCSIRLMQAKGCSNCYLSESGVGRVSLHKLQVIHKESIEKAALQALA